VEGSPQLRALGIGEIVDASINLFSRRAGLLIRTGALVIVPVQIIAFALTVAAGSSGSSVFGGDFSSNGSENQGLLLLASAIQWFTYLLLAGALYRTITEEILGGREVDPGEAYGFSARRYHSMFWIVFLYILCVLLGFIALIVPGVWLLVALSLSIPVLLSEGARGSKALKRSRELVKGQFWHTAGALMVALLIITAAQFATGILAGLVLISTSNDTIEALVATIQNAAVSLLIQPFQLAVIAFLYFDLRVRKEGIDLAIAAEQIGSPSAQALHAYQPRPSAPPPPPPGYDAG
jgi:hypothetical protein